MKSDVVSGTFMAPNLRREDCADERRNDVADRVADERSAAAHRESVVRRLLRVDDEEPRAGPHGDVAEPGRRVHGERAADDEEEVALFGGGERRIDDGRNERLAERDRRGLEDASARLTRRVLLTGVDTDELLAHRRTPAARHALDL